MGTAYEQTLVDVTSRLLGTNRTSSGDSATVSTTSSIILMMSSASTFVKFSRDFTVP